MKAIEYLNRVRNLSDQINRKIRTAERWREMSFSITAAPLKQNYNPNRSTSAPFEKCILKANELEREVDSDLNRLTDMKYETEAMICMLDDETCQDILRLRYVELFMWEDVIAVIDKSRSQIFRKHKKAIRQLDKILSEICDPDATSMRL